MFSSVGLGANLPGIAFAAKIVATADLALTVIVLQE